MYQAFYDDYPTLRAFLHSHSYTGNPLACAAALATLDIFEQDNVIEANLKACLAPSQAAGEAFNIGAGGREYLIDVYHELFSYRRYPARTMPWRVFHTPRPPAW